MCPNYYNFCKACYPYVPSQSWFSKSFKDIDDLSWGKGNIISMKSTWGNGIWRFVAMMLIHGRWLHSWLGSCLISNWCSWGIVGQGRIRSLSPIGEGKGSTVAPLSNSVVAWAPINSSCQTLMDGLKTLPLIPLLSVVASIGFLEHGCAVAWFKCNSSCQMLLNALIMIWPSTGFVDHGCSVPCWCCRDWL